MMLYDLPYLTDAHFYEALEEFVCQQKRPFFESAAIRAVYGIENISDLAPIELYRYHFALFNMLYRLQDKYYKEDKFLYVHFMRSFLASYPAAGECREYDPYTGLFCREPAVGESVFCEFHKAKIDDTSLETQSIKYFYYSEDNFYRLTEDQAGAFLSGTWELLFNYDQYKTALSTLSLPENCTLDMVKTQYRTLAKKCHPDLSGGTVNEEFLKLNDAYQLLLKLLPVVQFNAGKAVNAQ